MRVDVAQTFERDPAHDRAVVAEWGNTRLEEWWWGDCTGTDEQALRMFIRQCEMAKRAAEAALRRLQRRNARS